ncbi:MAG: adenylyltransferase/cytidyltransferase family protein [Candidatus Levybacteria bacterium]|nr:adenylyltransferase/cytidyltransferase family protein [Candidatus Levybacteria bacterium]
MNKIITTEQASELGANLHQQNKRVVLVGGCFDILHLGHVSFLNEAKSYGNILCVLLESDETIKKSKGPKRPINAQNDRALLLSALMMVDYVLILPPNMTNADYDALVFALKPAIIATTKGDSNRVHKERQAVALHAKVIDVVEPVKNQSTTKLFKILNEL